MTVRRLMQWRSGEAMQDEKKRWNMIRISILWRKNAGMMARLENAKYDSPGKMRKERAEGDEEAEARGKHCSQSEGRRWNPSWRQRLGGTSQSHRQDGYCCR